MKKICNLRKGFTLIELLVVIAIIAILIGIIAVNYVSVRQRARDGERKSDIGQIQSALEMYRADNTAYPTDGNGNNRLDLGEINNILGVTYLGQELRDPLENNMGYNGGYYYYESDGLTYTLAVCLENGSDGQGVSTSPGGGGTCSSSLYYVKNNP